MERVNVRLIGRSFRGKGAGEIVAVSRRDARLLTRIGRAEAVEEKAAKKSNPPAREGALATPEAPLATVAHTEADAPAKRRTTTRKPRKSAGK